MGIGVAPAHAVFPTGDQFYEHEGQEYGTEGDGELGERETKDEEIQGQNRNDKRHEDRISETLGGPHLPRRIRMEFQQYFRPLI
jgi:hypothetical protein